MADKLGRFLKFKMTPGNRVTIGDGLRPCEGEYLVIETSLGADKFWVGLSKRMLEDGVLFDHLCSYPCHTGDLKSLLMTRGSIIPSEIRRNIYVRYEQMGTVSPLEESKLGVKVDARLYLRSTQ